MKSILITALCAIASVYAPVSAAGEPPEEENVSYSGTLPVIFIDTDSGTPVTSKTVYLPAQFRLDPMGCAEIEPVGSETEPFPIEIRGRGHSSWKGDKKPYKIKLSAKTPLMGMPSNKHWALLKPSENTVAGLRLGRLMGMAWTPDFRPVEVVLNGDYIGLYFLTETIRIGKNRVNIYEQQDGETDPELIGGGWLVEIDNYKDDCQITIPENNRWNLTLRYHSPEELSEAQSEWLTDEFKSINSAIYSADKRSTEWEEYIDVESMARFFLIQEVMDNPDGFHGSFYLHKDLGEGAKWVAGPIWDLVCYNREKTDYTFRMKVHYTFTPHWIGEIIQYDSFCRSVAEVWHEVYPDRLAEIYGEIDEVILPLAEAWSNDCRRWNEDASQTAEFRAEKIKGAIGRNIDWMARNLPVSQFSSAEPIRSDEEKGPIRVYNLQGIGIGEYENGKAAVSNLKAGVYIIDGKKMQLR